MQKSNVSDQYRSAQIETASQIDVILLAYDGIVSSLEIVARSLDQSPKDLPTATENINKAQQIIEVLSDGLNFDVSEIADRLDHFYEFARNVLIQVNFSKDADEIKKLIDLVKQIRQFWEASSSQQIKAEPQTQPTEDQPKIDLAR